MIQDANEILYTPIDSDPIPEYNITKLLSWVKEHSPVQDITNRKDASKHELISKVYPWHIIYPRYNLSWNFDFDKEFPEIANFYSDAFKLKEDEINTVTMLPIKSDFSGTGFWHNDRDSYGLRMYLENQEPGDFLLIKPTVAPYLEIMDIKWDSNYNITGIPLQDITHSAKLKNPRQVFYLNNKRAVHAVQVPQPDKLRIAVIISPVKNYSITNRLNSLICDSAKKFTEHSIYWQPPTF
jgi:hypothetical protein